MTLILLPTRATNHLLPARDLLFLELRRFDRLGVYLYLGVITNDTLSFCQHIDAVSNRVLKLTYVFKSMRHVSDPQVIRMVNLALCQSTLMYCISV